MKLDKWAIPQTKIINAPIKIDKIILEILVSVFPQLKYFNIFSKLNTNLKYILYEVDFIFIVSLLIIDETDNVDYFLYKYTIL